MSCEVFVDHVRETHLPCNVSQTQSLDSIGCVFLPFKVKCSRCEVSNSFL